MKRKELIGVAVFAIVMVGILLIGTNRIEKIENGEMTLVSQSQMDR